MADMEKFYDDLIIINLYIYLVQIFDSSARSQCAFGGQVQYYIMPATSATKFSSKRKAMAASPQPQSSLSSTKSGIFETIVFTKKILQTTKSGGGPANKRQQSCTSLWSAVGFSL